MFQNTVYLLDTCLAAHLYPALIRATKNLIELLDIRVIRLRKQACCGLVALNSGYFGVARNMAKGFISNFWEKDYPILIPSGSCTAMVRYHYPRLFKGDPVWEERALKISKRTYELTEFLSNQPELSLKLSSRKRVLFHPSCQALRLLQIHHQPLELLSKIKGIEPAANGFLAEGWDRCCGFGGLFHVKYPEISQAMRDSKIELMERQRPDTIVGIDMGCLLHIKKGLRQRSSKIKVMHIAELLWESVK